MDEEEDKDIMDETNVLMVFNPVATKPRGPKEYSDILLWFTCALKVVLIFQVWGRCSLCVYSCLLFYRV